MRLISLAFLVCICAPHHLLAADPLRLGDRAPNFELPGIDGKTYTLGDFSDARVLVICFTCNHCPTAQVYEPDIKKFVGEYAPKGVTLVAISSNSPEGLRPDELGWADLGDTYEDMKVHAERHGFNFRYLYDGDTQEAAAAYDAKATPHFFVFDAERKLRYRGGFTDKEDPAEATQQHLRNAVDAVLAGAEVPVAESRAWGCSIKWKSKAPSVAAWHAKWEARPVSLSDTNLEGIRDLRKNASGKFRLVNLWATWCVPCVAEFPDLVRLAQIYANRPVEVVTISIDKAAHRDRAEDFLEKQHAAFTNLIASDVDLGELAKALDDAWQGPVPHTILIAPGGEIVWRHTGAIDLAEARSVIIRQIGRYWDHKKK